MLLLHLPSKIHLWILGRGNSDQVLSKDFCGYKNVGAVGRLLTASGRCIDGNRIYLDPLNWDDKTCGQSWSCSWLEAILGLRSMTSEDVPKSPKTWILRPAPRGGDMSDVESFLVASQFSDVSFTSKKLERFGTTWTFKALRNRDQS